ncbi:MAG: RNA 2',3'-cyclic phosphodiesterase [Erysipelotrichaceae bacterium]|nr:RNA 2',3'-cyclic phosphodiesterase [Erysipelotrichaceae bacterium]
MRIFIAYRMDEQTKSEILFIQEQVKPIYPNGRFKQPKNMHMTLKYIGDVTIDQFNRLITEIDRTICEYALLNVELNQLGFFGKSTKNHTLWIGCQAHPSMTQLSEAMTSCAVSAGISVNQTPFVPHITLAQHGTLLSELPRIETINVQFDQVCVFLSSRIEGELIYQPLRCWKLT